MKLARLFLAAVAAGTLAACSDSVTAPEAKSTVKPAQDATCAGTIVYDRLADGTVVARCSGYLGSGG